MMNREQRRRRRRCRSRCGRVGSRGVSRDEGKLGEVVQFVDVFSVYKTCRDCPLLPSEYRGDRVPTKCADNPDGVVGDWDVVDGLPKLVLCSDCPYRDKWERHLQGRLGETSKEI